MPKTLSESPYATNPPADKASGHTPSGRKLWIWRFLILILPVLIIVAAVAGTMVLGALKDEPEEKAEVVKAVPVLTTATVQDNVTLSVDVQGEVQPRTQINIAAQVSGKITFMSPKFIAGGRFNKGDLLIRIEPTEFELLVVQARADVAQSQTVLTREKSESALALSDWTDLNRAGTPSPLTLRAPQMAEAAAKLEAASAGLERAKLQLSRTSLYAPFSGRVTERRVDQGEFVSAGSALGQVYATNIMDVRLPMSDDDLRRAGLRLGFQASTNTPAIPVRLSATVAGVESEWTGEIVRTDSRFDSQTRVLYAYAEVRNPFGKHYPMPLAPGLYVKAEIEGQSLPDMLIIPRAALRGDDRVYVATKDNTLTIKTVDVVSSDMTRVIIRSGLSVGDAVITSPVRGVSEGMSLNVVDPKDGEDDDAKPSSTPEVSP